MEKDLREALEGYDIEVIDENRVFNIIGEINDELVELFANWKDNLSELESPVTIRIHSPGGCADSMFAIIGLMEDFKEIHGEVIGICHSAALGIFSSCHIRKMTKYAECLFHLCIYGSEGNINDHKENLKNANKMQAKYEEIIMNATNLGKKDFKRNKDWFIDRNLALKIGLINN